jgi:hypothetical protein
MAMPAGLVAQKSQVDLQGMSGIANQPNIISGKSRFKWNDLCGFLFHWLLRFG